MRAKIVWTLLKILAANTPFCSFLYLDISSIFTYKFEIFDRVKEFGFRDYYQQLSILTDSLIPASFFGTNSQCLSKKDEWWQESMSFSLAFNAGYHPYYMLLILMMWPRFQSIGFPWCFLIIFSVISKENSSAINYKPSHLQTSLKYIKKIVMQSQFLRLWRVSYKWGIFQKLFLLFFSDVNLKLLDCNQGIIISKFCELSEHCRPFLNIILSSNFVMKRSVQKPSWSYHSRLSCLYF